MYAIIETGGKQYRVQKDDVFKVEKLKAEVGETVTFENVVALGGDSLKVGKPFVAGAAVQAEVLEQGKNDKVIIYKYKAKKDYRKKNSHRQPYTLVKITVIGNDKAAAKTTKSSAMAAPKAEKPAAKVEEVKASLSMKKAELQEIAEGMGLKVNGKDTKADIFAAIEAANK